MPSLMSHPQSRFYAALTGLLFSFVLLLFFFQESLPVIKNIQFSHPRGNHSIPLGQTALQYDPPPEGPPFGALVIAAQNTTDIDWAKLSKNDWFVYEYDVDKPDNEDPRLRFPKSKGNEAMVYLSYIIDNYDDLPWSVVFVHGHREAWHQEDDIVKLIQSLNRIALARQGYISLRCDWYPSCPAEIRPIHHDSVVWGPNATRKGTELAIEGNWRFLFPDVKIPNTIASPCCAQFAVTRQAIMKNPKSDYERLRDWLMGSLLEDYLSGRVLEKLWAYIFTGEFVHCPPPEQCACEWFGRCGENEWSVPPEGLPPPSDWP